MLLKSENWFVSKDVAEILGYSETAMMTRRPDDDEKTNLSFRQDGSNYQTNVTIINESGLYNAVLSSKKLEAKSFKKWITSDVLPTIRKTGGYGIPDPMNMIPPSKSIRPVKDTPTRLVWLEHRSCLYGPLRVPVLCYNL